MEKALSSKEKYHHGNLKNELISHGLEDLEIEGIEKVSMRSLAKKIGVSKTAPYKHFPKRIDFLGALSNEGFRQLHKLLEDTLEQNGSSLSEIGGEYFSFAKERPTLYKLMFSSLICELSDEHSLWARKTLSLLCQSITGDPIPKEATTSKLISVWAYFHGVVSLYLDGIYPENFPPPDWEVLIKNFPGERFH